MNTLVTSRSRFLSKTTRTKSKAETGRYTFPTLLPRKPLWFTADDIKPPSKTEYNKCVKALKNHSQEFCRTGNWVWRQPNSADYFADTGRACHAQMNYTTDNQAKGLIGTENGAKRKHGESYKKLIEPFLTWFLYHSPYGEIILNRDDYEMCRDYGFIMPFNVPQPLFMNACIISRHFYECSTHSFEFFNELVDSGIDPFIAYNGVFNSMMSCGIEKTRLETTVYQANSGHRVTKAYGFKCIQNYYNGVWGKHASRKAMADYKTIQRANYLFKTSGFRDAGDTYAGNGVDYPNLEKWFQGDKVAQKAVTEHRQKQKAGANLYKPPNPFKPAAHNRANYIPTKTQFTYAELGVVLRHIQERIERNK